MISGPIVPRAGAGLALVLERHLDVVEWGLRPHLRGLELDGLGPLQLARDALGRPTLVAASNAPGDLAATVLHAHAQLADQPWLLRRLFPHRIADGDALRTIVVGVAPEPHSVDELRRLRLSDLVVVRLHEFAVEGQRQWAARIALSTPERGDEDGFTLPSGLAGLPFASAGHDLLSWLQRLDADVVAEGDRYSRRVYARGRRLCAVAPHDGELCAWRADGTAMPLRDRASAECAADAIMADFAAGLHCAGDAGAAAGGAEAAAVRTGNGAVSEAMAWLRRGAERPALSREELHALQSGDGSS